MGFFSLNIVMTVLGSSDSTCGQPLTRLDAIRHNVSWATLTSSVAIRHASDGSALLRSAGDQYLVLFCLVPHDISGS